MTRSQRAQKISSSLWVPDSVSEQNIKKLQDRKGSTTKAIKREWRLVQHSVVTEGTSAVAEKHTPPTDVGTEGSLSHSV